MKRLLLSSVALFALGGAASADILGGQNWTGPGTTLTLNNVVPGGNQPQNIQCVICGDNQPQQSVTFGYNNFHNNGGMNDIIMFSTATIGGSLINDQIGTGYGVAFLEAYLASVNANPLTFSIGFDVNDTRRAQTLESFYFLNLTQHTILASFSPGPGGTLVPSVNNGTGFPDYTLTGFSLTGVNPGDQVIFFARISGANDGPESFFITPSPAAPVPGPILGAGLPGLIAGCLGLFGFNRLRRKRGEGLA